MADSHEELVAATTAAASFFAERIRASWAPGYLASRGFGEQDWRRWGIGYAPASWTALTSHLQARGFTGEAIGQAGLAKVTARGTLVDTFRDRIMFPVRALDGTVAGFIGRAPPNGKPPVYLNTATTALYHKGSVLFGLYEAGRPASVVLTEGPLDAMAVTVAGAAGVASCGTALTATQAALLAASGTVVVAYDGDPPGRHAAVRAYHLLREVAADLSTVPFPPGQDPAGFLREHGASALARLLTSQAHPLADLAIDECLASFAPWLQFTDGKFGALRAVSPHIAALPAGQVARQVARTASRLDLTHAEVTAAVTAAVREVI